MPTGALNWYKKNVEDWEKLVNKTIELWLNDDVTLNFVENSDGSWLIKHYDRVVCENCKNLDIWQDTIYSELTGRGWSDIPTMRNTMHLLVLTKEYKHRSYGQGYWDYDIDNLGEFVGIKEIDNSDDYEDIGVKILQCYTLNDEIKVIGTNGHHYNTIAGEDKDQLTSIFMDWGRVIMYQFDDGDYIIQSLNDDEFNTVRIPERFEGELNHDEWPYMYWINANNGYEMKINMESFDWRYLHHEDYDPEEEF